MAEKLHFEPEKDRNGNFLPRIGTFAYNVSGPAGWRGLFPNAYHVGWYYTQFENDSSGNATVPSTTFIEAQPSIDDVPMAVAIALSEMQWSNKDLKSSATDSPWGNIKIIRSGGTVKKGWLGDILKERNPVGIKTIYQGRDAWTKFKNLEDCYAAHEVFSYLSLYQNSNGVANVCGKEVFSDFDLQEEYAEVPFIKESWEWVDKGGGPPFTRHNYGQVGIPGLNLPGASGKFRYRYNGKKFERPPMTPWGFPYKKEGNLFWP
jgi:hypothetical protein